MLISPRSDRVAESSPHTMYEDRMILESVLAQNRDAIIDLHNLTNTGQAAATEQGKTLERQPSRAGDHHRQLSDLTGVEIPPIPGVLPPTAADQREADSKSTPPSSLARTFSKRGVRLGVHMSLLDLSAHEAPSRLNRKWIQHAHLRQQLGHGPPGDRRGLTALPELSRISEVDTAAGSSHDLRLPQPTAEPIIPEVAESPTTVTPARDLLVPYNTPADVSPVRTNEPATTRNRRSFTMGSKLRHVMSKLSMTNLRSPTASRSKSNGRGTTAITDLSSMKGKEKEEDADVVDERWSQDRTRPGRINIDQENSPGRRPFLEALKQKFEKSPLTTPDIEKEFEYGRYSK